MNKFYCVAVVSVIMTNCNDKNSSAQAVDMSFQQIQRFGVKFALIQYK